jgi:hypothetical protein
MTRNRLFFLLTAAALSFAVLFFAASCRRAAEPGAGATPEPTVAASTPANAQTITTNSNGTTATYQVEETRSSPPEEKCLRPTPEVVYYTASPASVFPGGRVLLKWYVRGAKLVKVGGHTFSGEKGSLEIVPRLSAPAGKSAGGKKGLGDANNSVDYPLAGFTEDGCLPAQASVKVTFKRDDPDDDKEK